MMCSLPTGSLDAKTAINMIFGVGISHVEGRLYISYSPGGLQQVGLRYNWHMQRPGGRPRSAKILQSYHTKLKFTIIPTKKIVGYDTSKYYLLVSNDLNYLFIY